MNKIFTVRDVVVLILYFFAAASYKYCVYRKRNKSELDAKGYFLAEGTLTWWAIGASLIVSNISA
jgi:SSS family solute:Na+ symporter